MSINPPSRARAWILTGSAVLAAVLFCILYVMLFGSPFNDDSQNEANDSAQTDAVSYPITDPDQFPDPDVALIAAQTNDSGMLINFLPENIQGGMLSIYDEVDDPADVPNMRSYNCKVAAGIESSDSCTIRLYFDGYVWVVAMLTVNGVPSVPGE